MPAVFVLSLPGFGREIPARFVALAGCRQLAGLSRIEAHGS